jgi:hypothetical protein
VTDDNLAGRGQPKALVANLRLQVGRNPYDRAVSDLIGELLTRSQSFRK